MAIAALRTKGPTLLCRDITKLYLRCRSKVKILQIVMDFVTQTGLEINAIAEIYD